MVSKATITNKSGQEGGAVALEDSTVQPAPFPGFTLILRAGVRERETSRPFGNLDAGRAAWLAAQKDGSTNYAALVSRDRRSWPCEWSTAGAFHDRTDSHRQEMARLAERITAEAREGYSVTVRDAPRGWRVVFTGSRSGTHSLMGSASTADRVLHHWCLYAT